MRSKWRDLPRGLSPTISDRVVAPLLKIIKGERLLFRGIDGMNHPEMDTETIVERIRQEAMRRKGGLPGKETGQGIETFRFLQSGIDPKTEETRVWRFVKKVQYRLQKFPFYPFLYSIAAKFKGCIPRRRCESVNLNDLVHYHDEDFIRNAYRVILKREPDTGGFNGWLSRLRSGQLNRIEILGDIRRSEEGRNQNVKVKGLRLRYLANKSYRIPVAGYFIRLLTAIMNLPKIVRTVNGYQVSADARFWAKADLEALEGVRYALTTKADHEALEGVRSALTTKADHEALEGVRSALTAKADHEALEGVRSVLSAKADREALATTTQDILKQISDQRLNILDQHRRFLLLLEEVRRRFPEPPSQEEMKGVLKEEDHILDALYVAFEDWFRGARAEIKRRLGVYLPLIEKLRSEKGDVSVLDVGCGRGEWLELLQENGYRAKGIDINRVALLQCRERGLDVTESDVIEFLKGWKRDVLDVLTGFHIIEHLSFRTLVSLFDEALAVLKPGGMIIFETPNPTNLLVSSYDFYRDPSHTRPLHPDTLDFIARSRGFVRTGSYFVLDEGPDLKLIKSTEWVLNDVNDYISVPRDFALIGYKP